MNILSIDAWGNERDGYEWNAWYKVGEIDKETFERLDSDEKIHSWLYSAGILGSRDLADYVFDDDQYNIVVYDADDLCPIFAIEYGPEY